MSMENLKRGIKFFILESPNMKPTETEIALILSNLTRLDFRLREISGIGLAIEHYQDGQLGYSPTIGTMTLESFRRLLSWPPEDGSLSNTSTENPP